MDKKTTSKETIKAPPFAVFSLMLTCVLLFTSSFLQHILRVVSAYLAPSLGLPVSRSREPVGYIAWLYLPGVLFSLFTGKIADSFGSPLCLLICSLMNTGGAFLFWHCVTVKASSLYFKLSIMLYGCGQILLRVPNKRLVVAYFQNYHCAFAISVNHTASHMAGVVSGVLASWLRPNYTFSIVFLVVALLSGVAIATSLVLKAVATVEERDDCSSIWANIKILVSSTDRIAWFIFVGGLLMDGCLVSIKNIEGHIFKTLLDAPDTKIMSLQGILKFTNIFAPFISYFLDIYPFRCLQLVFSSLIFNGVLVFYLVVWLKNTKINILTIAIVTICHRLNMAVFYSSFYPVFGVLFSKRVQGTGFGLIMSINSIGFVTLPLIFDKLDMKAIWVYFFMVFLSTLIFMAAEVDNRKRGLPANKSKH